MTTKEDNVKVDLQYETSLYGNKETFEVTLKVEAEDEMAFVFMLAVLMAVQEQLEEPDNDTVKSLFSEGLALLEKSRKDDDGES